MKRNILWRAAAGLIVAGIATLGTAGTAGATGGGPPPPNTNQVEYWCVAPASTGGIKTENVNSLTFTVPAAPTGKVWTLLVLKAGDENSTPVVNETFPAPVVGQSYERLTDDKNISHAILCYAPFADPCAEGGVDFPCDPCEDAEEGEICPPCEEGDEREVCQPSCEELENCPEIPCEQTREGCPTTTTTTITTTSTVPQSVCTSCRQTDTTTVFPVEAVDASTTTTPATTVATTVPETVPVPAPVAPPKESLPVTGASPWAIAGVGMALILAGAAVAAFARRNAVA